MIKYDLGRYRYLNSHNIRYIGFVLVRLRVHVSDHVHKQFFGRNLRHPEIKRDRLVKKGHFIVVHVLAQQLHLFKHELAREEFEHDENDGVGPYEPIDYLVFLLGEWFYHFYFKLF